MEYYSEPCSGDDERAEAPAGMFACEHCNKGFRLHGACFCTECLIELRELMWRGAQFNQLSADALRRYVRLRDSQANAYSWQQPEITRERAEREAAMLGLTYEKYMEPACMQGGKLPKPVPVEVRVISDSVADAMRYAYTNGTGGGMVVSSTTGSYNNVTSQFTSFYMS